MSVLFAVAFVLVALVALHRAAIPVSPGLALGPERGPPPEALDARFDAFWSWWSTAAPRLAAELDAGKPLTMTEEIDAHLHAIDPRLLWEVGPGLEGARHRFTLSTGGEIALRLTTARMVARGPADDDVFEFFSSKKAFPRGRDWSATVAGVRFDPAGFRVAIESDENREVLHLALHHPAFARLDELERREAAFVALDRTLGEDEVECWIGRVQTLDLAPPAGRSLEELRDEEEALAGRATGLCFLEYELEDAAGRPLQSIFNHALKRIDYLELDHAFVVAIELRHPTTAGLATDEEEADLTRMLDELLDDLQPDAVLLGLETNVGVQTLHLHAAAGGTVEARIEAWAARQDGYSISLAVEHDPTWRFLRPT